MAIRAWMMLFCSLLALASCGDRTSFNPGHPGKDAAVGNDGALEVAPPPADVLSPVADGVAPADVRVLPDAGADLSVPDLAPADVAGPDGAPPSDGLGPADLPVDRDTSEVRADASTSDAVADSSRTDGPGDLAPDLPREAGLDWPPFGVDGALADFCSGDSPRLVVNGNASSPTVTGASIPYDCCDGAELDVTSSSLAFPIVFSWRREARSGWVLPATVDLGNLPTGWSTMFYAGCNPVSSSCSGGSDWYTSGLEGTLLVARGTGQYDMSLCLHVQEPVGAPHSMIHSMDLYAPHVLAR